MLGYNVVNILKVVTFYVVICFNVDSIATWITLQFERL